MNLKLADVFWILMNKVDEIVIYIDYNPENPTPEYAIINKNTDINSIIDYMTMNIKYIGRDLKYDDSLIFRVVLTMSKYKVESEEENGSHRRRIK